MRIFDIKQGLFKKVVLVIFLFLRLEPSNAQIKGIIRDESTGKPLENVSIVLRSNGEHIYSLSDGSFAFLINKVPDTLEISNMNFESEDIILEKTDKKITVNMKQSGIKLSDVVVRNSKFLAGQIMKVDLNMIPVNSAQDLLRKVPGLFIAQHAGGGKAEQFFCVVLMPTTEQMLL